jgi:hypothetical protein
MSFGKNYKARFFFCSTDEKNIQKRNARILSHVHVSLQAKLPKLIRGLKVY